MAYDETKSYVLTASSAAITAWMSALYDHFLAAPGLWRLKSGAGSSAAGIIIEPKSPISGYNLGISIRRNGTTNFQVALDPLNSYTAAGGAGSGPTGASAQASAEVTLPITSIASTKIAISETPDCVLGGFFNATLTTSPQAFQIGRVFDLLRESFRNAPLLNNGLAILVGAPQLDSASGWSTGTGGASRVRHNGAWRPLDIDVLSAASANNPIPDSPNADRQTIVPGIFGAYNAASTLPMRCMVSRYIGISASAQNNCTILSSDTADEAWLTQVDGAFNTVTSKYCMTWEKGVAKPS
jgi:hypothetical protein